MMITSIHNPKVKRWNELLTKKGREKHSAFLIEGTRMIEEAIASNVRLEAILWETGRTFPFLNELSETVEKWEVSEGVMKKLTDTVQSQGIVAVVSMKELTIPEKVAEASLFLLVDGVQDPGNLGTIIRVADAAGVDGVFLGRNTVDLYNPKTVRSTMGSLFHLPVISEPLEEVIPYLQGMGVKIYASSLDTDLFYHEVEYPNKVGIIVGNEGNGISPEILKLADQKIKIPIYGKAESLNVGVATSLLLYEARRRVDFQ